MKLMRYGEPGSEKPAIMDDDGSIRSLEGIVDDIDGSMLGSESLQRLRTTTTRDLPIIDARHRVGPCVADVGKFICVGLNYADHAEESGMDVPEEPVIFMKATSAICGPYDEVMIPREATKVDWEVELGVVIGSLARYVSEEDALDHVAGYCTVNDISERDFQLNRGGTWVKGKSCDTFGPIGPWLVTTDEIPDPQDLDLFLEINDEPVQRSSTSRMIFPVAHLVSYISRFMSLHPGDIISTGTPPGVGLGMKPERYLKPGDVMHLGIEGLGMQQQVVVRDPHAG